MLAFSIEIMTFSIKILAFSIEIMTFFIEILSFSIEIMTFSIKRKVFLVFLFYFLGVWAAPFAREIHLARGKSQTIAMPFSNCRPDSTRSGPDQILIRIEFVQFANQMRFGSHRVE